MTAHDNAQYRQKEQKTHNAGDTDSISGTGADTA